MVETMVNTTPELKSSLISFCERFSEQVSK
jgi:hypothetical protein